MEEFANMIKIGLGYIADLPHGVLGFIFAMVIIVWWAKDALD